MLLVMKKDKGIALLLTLVIMIALAVMSVGLQSIIVASSKNNARSHILNVTYRVAEYGLENGRISLIQELTKVGTGIITNVKHLDLSEVENLHYEDNELTRSCLALHGYNKNDAEILELDLSHEEFISNRFWYTRLSSKHPTLIGHTAGPESFSTDPLFEDYTFEYFVQHIDIDNPIPGFNYIDMTTISISGLAGEDGTFARDKNDVLLLPKPEAEDITDEAWAEAKRTELDQWVYDNETGGDYDDEDYDDGRVFYRVISCGYSDPKKASNHIVPLQAYYSIGGEKGADINYIRNNLITEGFYRP